MNIILFHYSSTRSNQFKHSDFIKCETITKILK